MSSQVADFHHGSQTLRDFVSAIESSQTSFISSPLDLSFEPLYCAAFDGGDAFADAFPLRCGVDRGGSWRRE
ncbi:hypothetical protein F2Q70_00013612 [Brassica cretica]|uniref:Uncharacterized protein n=1 Tax=Brassica cretica TaxID=69181 RepID=A0A8S9LXB8_BRACR|nr:hypothetical protein F2Q70_00013612 [Brassica cretica]